jgi:hypothetical protein
MSAVRTTSMARCAPACAPARPAAAKASVAPARAAYAGECVPSKALRASRRRGGVALAALGNKTGDELSRFAWDKTPRGMGFFNNEDVSTTTDRPVSQGSSITMLSSLAPLFLLADAGLADDIKPSYFASLGLFVLSAPGLWSLVKRSAKSKVGRKTFEVAGPSATEAMPLDELAREVSMFFKRNNYVIADAGEVIVFEGNIAPERGTAAYITFCAAVGLLCIGLVCSIALPGGNAWYALALASPLSGSYYMENAGRKEQMKVKMVTADDDMTTDIIVEGDVEEIERMRRDLNLVEKGMVYVKGVLEK